MLKYLLLLCMLSSAARAQTYSVKDYGATGDGKTLETKAIQATIAAAFSKGGGIVLLPPGNYLSGSIILRSNIVLKIDSGAVLLGSTDIKDYPADLGVIELGDSQLFTGPLIYAENERNIGIAGKGKIDGQGFRKYFTPLPNALLRPGLVRFANCTSVKVENIEMINPARWTFHLRNCQQVLVKHIIIRSRANRNNDGIDVDGCQDVKITGCDINTEDDAIVLKSFKPETVRNILIEHNKLSSSCYALKIGTETLGDFRDIIMRNCVLTDSHGIGLLNVDGGNISDVTISNIELINCEAAIDIRIGDRMRVYPFDSTLKKLAPVHPGTIKNITIRNVKGNLTNSLDFITGVPGFPIENITLKEIHLVYKSTKLDKAPLQNPPENGAAYPKWTMFGVLPSHSFFIRHAKGIKLENVTIDVTGSQDRPTIVTDDVDGLKIVNSNFPNASGNSPVFSISNTTGLIFSSNKDLGSDFIKVIGNNNKNIIINKKSVLK